MMESESKPDDPAALADSGRIDEALEAAYEQGKRDALETDVDPVVELMNLARHFFDEGKNYRENARRGTGDKAEITQNLLADAHMDAASALKQLARHLDGESNRPAKCAHGEALAGDSNWNGVPWRSGGK